MESYDRESQSSLEGYGSLLSEDDVEAFPEKWAGFSVETIVIGGGVYTQLLKIS